MWVGEILGIDTVTPNNSGPWIKWWTKFVPILEGRRKLTWILRIGKPHVYGPHIYPLHSQHLWLVPPYELGCSRIYSFASSTHRFLCRSPFFSSISHSLCFCPFHPFSPPPSLPFHCAIATIPSTATAISSPPLPPPLLLPLPLTAFSLALPPSTVPATTISSASTRAPKSSREGSPTFSTSSQLADMSRARLNVLCREGWWPTTSLTSREQINKNK